MSNERYIKQALIAAACEHPFRERYMQRAFSAENLPKTIDVLTEAGLRLGKADFFAVDDDGKFIIDTPGFWRNFSKINDIVQKSGAQFTFEDFLRPLDKEGKRTLLSIAEGTGHLKKLFSFEVWKGRFDDMEYLWYKLPIPSRREVFGGNPIENKGALDLGLKRTLLAAEGRELPEDRLARANVTPQEINKIGTSNGASYEDVVGRLRAAGDYLRKEYVLLPDASGDTVFGYHGSWTKYENIIGEFSKHGERLEVSDFVRRLGETQSILQQAAANKALPKIFTPQHWVGRLQDMLDLWESVLPGWKGDAFDDKAFDRLYTEAESLTYAKAFDFRNFKGKADLLQPLDTSAMADDAQLVVPLGIKAFWDNFDGVQSRLNELGEAITLADLRMPSGPAKNSCLMAAANFGGFSRIVDILKTTGEQIKLEDFQVKNSQGTTLIDVLAERKELPLVFTEELWENRPSEMKALWNEIPAKHRAEMDIEHVEVSIQQEMLRQRARKSNFKLASGAQPKQR